MLTVNRCGTLFDSNGALSTAPTLLFSLQCRFRISDHERLVHTMNFKVDLSWVHAGRRDYR